jgi:hypothetical protein
MTNPTVMEIIELYDSLPAEDDGMVTFARAVLAKWGNTSEPADEPQAK